MDVCHKTRRIIILFVSVMFLILSGCKTASRSTSSEKNDISWLQKAGNITVTFKGMMTFDVGDPTGTAFTTYATELSVPAVPITWMGNIFNGTVTDSGTGYSLTDQVHGSVSADGSWVNEMTFSRSVFNQSGGSNFLVTLSNVPIVKDKNGNTTVLASFLKTGSDVQKHITKIEYTSGGTIGTTYVSTDWTDANGMLRLELQFATGVGTRPTGGPALSGGGM